MSATTPIDKEDPRGLRAEVRRLQALGFVPVPIPAGKKGPTGAGWHAQKVPAENFDPDGNAGLILGAPSGNLINVDGDCPEAIKLMPLLLPSTEMITGRPARGRSHPWYIGDESLPTERLQDPDKHTIVEFRCGTGGKGFQTVIPPSVHPSGEAYTWYERGAPSAVSARLLSKCVRWVGAATLLVRAFPEASRHDFALALAGALAEAGWKQTDGERMVSAVCLVGGSSAENAEAAARNTCDSTWRKVAAKDVVAGYSALARLVEPRAMRLVSRWLGLRAQQDVLPEDAYTREDLEALAAAEGLPDASALARRWVVQRGINYYVLTQKGYKGPYVGAELGLVISQYLGRAPIRRFRHGDNGNAIKMSPSEIVEGCGSDVDKIVADLTIERSRYDAASSTLYEAVCPLRDLEPEYDPDVQRWLEIMAGPRVDKLLDWISTCWDLSRQTAALYLSGRAGVGKGMLAYGLARLWSTGGPPGIEDVMGSSFNSLVVTCPLIFGDEIVRAPDSATLRSWVGADARQLKRKHVSDATLLGSPRLILAGNRKDLLRFDREDFAEDDRKAIASRFVHVHCSPEAVAHLESIGGRAGTEGWVRGDRIAKHAAWLALNREVVPGGRFLVEGDADDQADALATQGEVRGLVAEAACKALQRSADGKSMPQGGLFVGGGEIWINASWLHDNWNLFVGESHRVPTTKRLGAALHGMSQGESRRLGPRGSRPRCFSLKVDLILNYADEVGIGDPAAMRAHLDRGERPEGSDDPA